MVLEPGDGGDGLEELVRWSRTDGDLQKLRFYPTFEYESGDLYLVRISATAKAEAPKWEQGCESPTMVCALVGDVAGWQQRLGEKEQAYAAVYEDVETAEAALARVRDAIQREGSSDAERAAALRRDEASLQTAVDSGWNALAAAAEARDGLSNLGKHAHRIPATAGERVELPGIQFVAAWEDSDAPGNADTDTADSDVAGDSDSPPDTDG